MVITSGASNGLEIGLDVLRLVDHEPHFPGVRVGVHHGTIVERNTDVFGATVNIVARLTADAHVGQLLTTSTVAALTADHDHLTTTALGPTWLKNVGEPVEVFWIADHTPTAASQVLDPVCRMFVDAESAPARLPWRERGWHFCSFECAHTFSQDPDRYANPQRFGRYPAPVRDASTPPFTPARLIRTPVFWGLVFGAANVVVPLGFWWLDLSTVLRPRPYLLIAAVYIGFAVADGRPKVIAVETCVAAGFVVLAAIGVTETAWILVIAYFADGAKDLWQHRTHFVANTRSVATLLPDHRLARCRHPRHRNRRWSQFPLTGDQQVRRCLSGTLRFCRRTGRRTETSTKRTGWTHISVSHHADAESVLTCVVDLCGRRPGITHPYLIQGILYRCRVVVSTCARDTRNGGRHDAGDCPGRVRHRARVRSAAR